MTRPPAKHRADKERRKNGKNKRKRARRIPGSRQHDKNRAKLHQRKQEQQHQETVHMLESKLSQTELRLESLERSLREIVTQVKHDDARVINDVYSVSPVD